MDFKTFIYLANLLGIISFALSGIFKGIKHNHDLFGVTLLAIITSVGGGVMRDVLLNKIPNALINPQDIYVAVITTLVIYLPYLLFKPKFDDNVVKKARRLVLISDAVGLSLFVSIGANIAIQNSLNTIGVIIMATITAVGGGILRDILANETPFILKEDIYAILCVIAGFFYKIMIVDLQLNEIRTTIIIFFMVLIVRLIVIKKNLNLPK
ncbi:trimeric intracellular cation channel family protein [Streptobacillus notomytis]|uniref:trimeric intracellular cation channel family protein n=1 Tax=Streptobacillus notomytis TaxID=1712031 RepID=UPI00093725FA|nr:trimeric intracellular cation channel family protein [Streptobacillus notomytis]